MKKIFLGALALSVAVASCDKDDCVLGEEKEGLVTPRLESRIVDNVSPLSGILEAYPCNSGTSIFCGNYVNNKLSTFYGFYHIQDGSIYGDNNREISLPVGQYNMVYWGTPQYEEPIHTTPAIREPGLSIGSDLSKLYFELRQNSSDTTYIPVFDLVYGRQNVNIGEEDLQANMHRAVAGLKVIVKTQNNGVISSNVESIKVHIGGIAEKLNLYTAEPENKVKTVAFDLVRSVDNTEMSNAMIMLFPSAANPLIQLFVTLKDGTVHRLVRNLSSTLEANTRLTLNVVIGNIFSGGGTGNFTIENWNEATETIEFPMVD